MSDEEEDDDGDLFADSEKEGDDIEDTEGNAKSVSIVIPWRGLKGGVYTLLLNFAIYICSRLILHHTCDLCVARSKWWTTFLLTVPLI